MRVSQNGTSIIQPQNVRMRFQNKQWTASTYDFPPFNIPSCLHTLEKKKDGRANWV
ncbi:hypothetical protein LOZ80_38925 [Paenibacillus sp. HWE-109]|uniref:hypothetical protein n=1 Tax=Paenibacillus sp. HWE-109 TaxID=1306526 RepID=UPI001EDD22C8|nr:hypothetical protein [Paenibacillus sp. HWE-109]UKS27342.1 hypothetical protein LOZ80_38925 [Paenibacillus sp. HWE-109]